MRPLLIAFVSVLGVLSAYQAITGRRASKRPSRRSEEQVRRESALGVVFLAILLFLVVAGG